MKVEAPWWAKILIGVFMVATTVVGSLIGGWEYIKSTNKAEVKESEDRIMATMFQWRTERKAEIKAGDDIISAKVVGLADKVDSIDKNVRIVLKNQLKQISDLEDEDEPVYTVSDKPNEGNNI